MNDRLAAVIKKTDENRDYFEQFCRSLTVEELHSPIPKSHWLVRDYISHLASIDIWVGEWFEAMATGSHFIPRASDGGVFDIDKWNDERIDERREASVEELLTEAAETRRKLYESFPKFSDETLESRFNFRGRDISFIEYLEAWTLHDPAHSVDMLKGLPNLTLAPELKTWIGQLDPAAMREVADVEANKE